MVKRKLVKKTKKVLAKKAHVEEKVTPKEEPKPEPVDQSSDSDNSDSDAEETAVVPSTGDVVHKPEWTNRERVLVFCSRGSDFRTRHVMNDLKTIMPHSRSESKMSKQTSITMINEIASMAKCTKCIYFETRKKKDVYMWLANVEDGPSVKFLVHNIHTMEELRLTGNCLKASRPVLSFGAEFDAQPSTRLIKQMLKQVFATPNNHPRSQPFIDHIFSFSLTPDGKIWFRNFQVVDEKMELQEIGPRMVLEIAIIFAGSFQGSVLYENPNYESPNTVRRTIKIAQRNKYVNRKMAQVGRKEKHEQMQQLKLPAHFNDDLF